MATTNTAPKPVVLRAAHDYGVTSAALKVRGEQLKNVREGRAIQADADAIEHHILPQFAEQTRLDIDLVDFEALKKEVTACLRVIIFRAFDNLGDSKTPPTVSQIEHRRDTLVDTLVERVTTFGRDVADESYNEGFAARNTNPEALAARVVASLRSA